MVEIIVLTAIIVIVFAGFIELARYSLITQKRSEAKIEAANLAAEAIEAVRSVRDEDWNNLSSLSLGTKYYSVILANKWNLTLTDPGQINGIYDRWIIFERVYRDADDNISSSGAEDPDSKKVTATVEWNDHGQIKQFNLTTYFTNWTN